MSSDWSSASLLQSTCCSWRGFQVSLWHPHGIYQHSVNSVPGYPVPSLASLGIRDSTWSQTHMHVNTQYLQINESFKINHDYSVKAFDELQNHFVVLFHLPWKCSYKNTDKSLHCA